MAVSTIVLSHQGSNLARPVIIYDIIHSLMCKVLHIVDFLGSRRMESAPMSIEVLLRPAQSQSDESYDLRGFLSPTTRQKIYNYPINNNNLTAFATFNTFSVLEKKKRNLKFSHCSLFF